MRLFLDTGPFIARYSRVDIHHLDSVETFKKIGRGETPYRKLYTYDDKDFQPLGFHTINKI